MRSVVFGFILLVFFIGFVHPAEVFSVKPILLREGAVVSKWQNLLKRHAAESAEVVACKQDPSTCTAIQKHYLSLIDMARAAKPGIVNRAVNFSIQYTPDLMQYGKSDVWSTPLETLATGKGDCEDYAILKFLLFKDAGVLAEDRRLIITREKSQRGENQDHMVLALKVEGAWILLDSRHLSLLKMKETTAQILFVLDESDVYLALRNSK